MRLDLKSFFRSVIGWIKKNGPITAAEQFLETESYRES